MRCEGRFPFEGFDKMMQEAMKNWDMNFKPEDIPFMNFGMNFGKMKIDIYEEGNNYLVEAEIPGVEKSDIKLSVTDNLLKISLNRVLNDEVRKERKYIMAERFYGEISREVEIPQTADTEKINAKYENGVLTITLPKKEVVDPNRREIIIE